MEDHLNNPRHYAYVNNGHCFGTFSKYQHGTPNPVILTDENENKTEIFPNLDVNNGNTKYNMKSSKNPVRKYWPSMKINDSYKQQPLPKNEFYNSTPNTKDTFHSSESTSNDHEKMNLKRNGNWMKKIRMYKPIKSDKIPNTNNNGVQMFESDNENHNKRNNFKMKTNLMQKPRKCINNLFKMPTFTKSSKIHSNDETQIDMQPVKGVPHGSQDIPVYDFMPREEIQPNDKQPISTTILANGDFEVTNDHKWLTHLKKTEEGEEFETIDLSNESCNNSNFTTSALGSLGNVYGYQNTSQSYDNFEGNNGIYENHYNEISGSNSDINHPTTSSLKDLRLRPRKNKLAILKKEPRSRVFLRERSYVLRRWLVQHFKNPFPCKEQKEELAKQTKMSYNQICEWFGNARRRISRVTKHIKDAKLWGQKLKYYNSVITGKSEPLPVEPDDEITTWVPSPAEVNNEIADVNTEEHIKFKTNLIKRWKMNKSTDCCFKNTQQNKLEKSISLDDSFLSRNDDEQPFIKPEKEPKFQNKKVFVHLLGNLKTKMSSEPKNLSLVRSQVLPSKLSIINNNGMASTNTKSSSFFRICEPFNKYRSSKVSSVNDNLFLSRSDSFTTPSSTVTSNSCNSAWSSFFIGNANALKIKTYSRSAEEIEAANSLMELATYQKSYSHGAV